MDAAGRIVCDWLPGWHGGGEGFGHTYVHEDGSCRFAPQTWCARCTRHMSGLFKRWVQRAQRLLPGLEYAWAVEETSGRFGHGRRWHRHVLLSGIPRWIPGKARDKLAADWAELAGNLDLGKPRGKGADLTAVRKLAYYLSKYLTKAQTRMAPGYSRWGRSRGYAPGIPMGLLPEHKPEPWGDGEPAVCLGGWADWARRHGASTDAPAYAAATRIAADEARVAGVLLAAGLITADEAGNTGPPAVMSPAKYFPRMTRISPRAVGQHDKHSAREFAGRE